MGVHLSRKNPCAQYFRLAKKKKNASAARAAAHEHEHEHEHEHARHAPKIPRAGCGDALTSARHGCTMVASRGAESASVFPSPYFFVRQSCSQDSRLQRQALNRAVAASSTVPLGEAGRLWRCARKVRPCHVVSVGKAARCRLQWQPRFECETLALGVGDAQLISHSVEVFLVLL